MAAVMCRPGKSLIAIGPIPMSMGRSSGPPCAGLAVCCVVVLPDGRQTWLTEIPEPRLDNTNRSAILNANRVVGGRSFLWEDRRTGNPVQVRDGPRRCNRVFEGSSNLLAIVA